MASVGRRIRDLRIGKGWTQAQLAKQSGISEKTIQRDEMGLHHPTRRVREHLAIALGVDPDFLKFSASDIDDAVSRDDLMTMLEQLDHIASLTSAMIMRLCDLHDTGVDQITISPPSS